MTAADAPRSPARCPVAGESARLDGGRGAIERAFADVLGLPAWGVRKGHGGMLTFEFGPPHLVVREPIAASPGVSDEVRRSLARRRVYPRGAWHLWIRCCDWLILSGAEQVACSEAPDRAIEAAVQELDGQRLIGVEVDPAGGASRFCFDLGGVLHTWPYGERDETPDDQWSLYTPTGDVLTYLQDGGYVRGPGSGSESPGNGP